MRDADAPGTANPSLWRQGQLLIEDGLSEVVPGIYQRHMGWYDGNPANLWPHPPEAVAPRYIAAMGGRDGALGVARQAWEESDYRWCAEVGKHLVFADRSDREARELLADALEQLGYGAENGTWRNAYLAGATELRAGNFGTPVSAGTDILAALAVAQVFDGVAVRVDGPRAWDEHLRIAWHIADERATHLCELRNGALNYRIAERVPDGVTAFTLTRRALIRLVMGDLDLQGALEDGTVTVEGDPAVLGRLVGLLAPVDPGFEIVTP